MAASTRPPSTSARAWPSASPGLSSISNSTITANQSISGTGGGIESFNRLTLTSVTVSNNIADAPGRRHALHRPAHRDPEHHHRQLRRDRRRDVARSQRASPCRSPTPPSPATTPWTGPAALGANSEDGGGRRQWTPTAASRISRSTISGNDASRNGGGIYFRDNPSGIVGTLSLTNDTISGNTANNNGGGLYVESGTLTVNYSTIPLNIADQDNNASGPGGGAYWRGRDHDLQQQHPGRAIQPATARGTTAAPG